ncbi:MAG: sigma-70 family RNA polymerase sigma factor [Propionibacteriales bacterium]|nr:sigma-70 family RNA polymerase sigma factor [Propionibacteriales bacterium]
MDDAEFDEFYTASFARLVGQVYAMTGNLSEAQDCVQDAFFRAWQHRKDLGRHGSAEGWVRTTAWRLAVSRWRRTKETIRFRDRAMAPREPEVPGVDHPALVAALREIPADQRRAIVLYHVCDLPVAVIAAETGVAEGTVKARLSRGRANLAALLETDEEVARDA